MIKNLKRTLALMLSIVMIFSSTLTAFANDGESIASSEAETSAQIEKTVAAEEETSTEAPKVEATTEAEQKEDAAPAKKDTARPQAFDVELKDVAAYFGEDATFTIKTDGDVRSFQWQMSKDNGKRWSNLSKRQYGSSENLVIKADQKNNGRMFRCEVTFKNGAKAVSDAARLIVKKAPAFPAVRLESAKVEGVTVNVDAPEGALPEGVTIDVAKVSLDAVQDVVDTTKGVEGKVVAAVDITFFDANSKEIEPNVPIKVEMASKEIAKVESPTVIHIDTTAEQIAEADVEAEEVKATTNEEAVKFSSDKFSIYAVIEPGQGGNEARAKVEFYGKNDSVVATYYVKNSDQIPPENEDDRDPDVQYIDDIVTDPGIGGTLPSDQIFVGWYIGTSKDYITTTTPKTIEDIRQYLVDQTFVEGDVVKIYAMIFRVFTVSYLDEANISMGSDEIKILTSQSSTSYTVSKNYTPTDPTKNFEGWLTENDSSITDAQYEGAATTEPYKMGTTMTISGNITFTVSAPKGRWLTFDENAKGATYNAPQFVKDGDVTKAPTLEMKRLGYEFVGWYTVKYADDATPDESTRFEFGHELDQPTTTIYAKWKPVATANYTVLFWKQNVNGTGYDFDGSQTLSGNVGTAITVTSSGNTVRVTGASNYTVDKGFSYDHSDTGKTIAAQGNTVVNVYINRNTYTLSFQIYDYTYTVSTNDNDNNPAKYGDVNGQKARVYWNNGSFRTTNRSNGPVYTGTVYTRSNGQSWISIKDITALYEQNISNNFPIVGTNGVTYDQGERWKPQSNNLGWSEVMVYIDTMPNESVTFHLDTKNTPLKTMNYYVEALETDTDTVTYNGVKYTLYNSINARYNGVTAEDFVDLDGFEKVAAVYNGQVVRPNSDGFYIYDERNNQTINFYYKRLKYKINFMDGRYFDGNNNPLIDEYASTGHWKDEENLTYGANISSYNKGGDNYYEPECRYPGFVFEGWYIDDACTSPYTFTTMSKGITVYAKWRQVQYRVFMHPNAKLPDGTNDNTLDWGSDDQEMNFRVSYMEQVSMPTGLRNEYEFIGWFLDEATTEPFNVDTKLTEDVVKADYDKTLPENYTDPMNKFGEIEGTGSNSDLTGNNGGDRFWITKKLDLYGKWSAILTGAQGIGVIYDANGGSDAPNDTKKYKDNVQAVAQAASTAPANERFLYWVVQKWNGNDYVDATDENGHLLVVYPGDAFTVLKSYAKVTDLSEGDEGYIAGEVYKAYTMQLRAQYGPTQASKDTYINWYRNWDNNDTATSGLLHNDKDLQINQAVDIYTLVNDDETGEPIGVPKRVGYKFLGWAREQEYELDESGKPTGDAIAYYENPDIYLKWVEAKEATETEPAVEAHYEVEKSTGNWVTVTQVAADEKMPYQAFYAVWEAEYFYIYHSGTKGGNVEKIQVQEDFAPFDKADKTLLYGGYYRFENKDEFKSPAGEGVVPVTGDNGTEAYDGSNWEWYTPETAPSFTPEEGEYIYIKEVPTTYLLPYEVDTYNKVTMQLFGIYLLSAADDGNYSEVGFYAAGKYNTASLNDKVTIKKGENSEPDMPADVELLIGDISGNNQSGKILLADEEYLKLNSGLDYTGIAGGLGLKTIRPYWKTPDGVTVMGNKQRAVTVKDVDGDGVVKVQQTKPEVKYVDAKVAIKMYQ